MKLYNTPSSLILGFVLMLFVLSCKQNKPIKRQSRVNELPYYQSAEFTPHWFSGNKDSLKGFHKISPFKLINQESETITEQTFANKIYVTDFFFTSCPGICPQMTENMAVLQTEFLNDDEVLLLSHSVTPERDSVAILKNYATVKKINSKKWHLVTGIRQQIYSLGRNDYFVEEDLGVAKTDEDFLHTENFVLIDKNSHIRGIYNGLNKTDIQQLIADIKTLKLEK